MLRHWVLPKMGNWGDMLLEFAINNWYQDGIKDQLLTSEKLITDYGMQHKQGTGLHVPWPQGGAVCSKETKQQRT